MAENKLYFGDNLDVLRRHVPDESVDLVYLDPPFQSGRDYNVLFREQSGDRSAAQIKAFEDTWRWDIGSRAAWEEVVERGGDVSRVMQAFMTFLGENDMLAYLSMMAPRLIELRRVLKPTGSLYLHCDPTASHYLKMLLDAVFGPANFRNEIIWHYKFRMMMLSRFFNRKHDVILFYAKSPKARINMAEVAEPWTRDEIIKTRKQAIYKDEDGREWIWMPGPRGRSKNKKKYLDTIIDEGKALDDVWDMPIISSSAKERLGYPTQKPEHLLERIIRASSNEGDVVLDPFCGCGTTIAVAHDLKRRWIGIDITYIATNLIKHRLQSAFGPGVRSEFEVHGEPVTVQEAEALAKVDRFEFENWALGLVGARKTDPKKGADKGIDGRLYFHDHPGGQTRQMILSVKSGNVGPQYVRDLRGVLEREKAEIGVLITLQPPTKRMVMEAASGGFYESWQKGGGSARGLRKYPRIQIFTVEELLAGKRVDYPETAGGNVTFRRAPKYQPEVAVQLPLDGGDGGPAQEAAPGRSEDPEEGGS